MSKTLKESVLVHEKQKKIIQCKRLQFLIWGSNETGYKIYLALSSTEMISKLIEIATPDNFCSINIKEINTILVAAYN